MTRSDATHTGPTGARILTAVRGYAFGTAAPKVLVLFIGMYKTLAGCKSESVWAYQQTASSLCDNDFSCCVQLCGSLFEP